MTRWDNYFLQVCRAISSNSPCLSRQIGAILVRDNSILVTGYNGPPRGIPHCSERYEKDKLLKEELFKTQMKFLKNVCPRRLLGYSSGQGLNWCYAAHAERNCLIAAARNGVITLGTTLFMNSVIPCKDCLTELINAGVEEIVVQSLERYDKAGEFLIENSRIKLRTFNLGNTPTPPKEKTNEIRG